MEKIITAFASMAVLCAIITFILPHTRKIPGIWKKLFVSLSWGIAISAVYSIATFGMSLLEKTKGNQGILEYCESTRIGFIISSCVASILISALISILTSNPKYHQLQEYMDAKFMKFSVQYLDDYINHFVMVTIFAFPIMLLIPMLWLGSHILYKYDVSIFFASFATVSTVLLLSLFKMIIEMNKNNQN